MENVNGSPTTYQCDKCQTTTDSQQEMKKVTIEKCINALVHVSECRTATCCLPSCQRMKRVVMHIKTCKRRTCGGCPICKQLVALCCHHARHCQEAKCPVPLCLNIKMKLKQKGHHVAGAVGGSGQVASQQQRQPQQQSAGASGGMRQALQELKKTLGNPNITEKQNQILHILRSNPPLMSAFSAFIKKRQAMAIRQQQQQQQQDQQAKLMVLPINPSE